MVLVQVRDRGRLFLTWWQAFEFLKFTNFWSHNDFAERRELHLYPVPLTSLSSATDISIQCHWHLYPVQLTSLSSPIDISIQCHWHLYPVPLTSLSSATDISIQSHWHSIQCHWHLYPVPLTPKRALLCVQVPRLRMLSVLIQEIIVYCCED